MLTKVAGVLIEVAVMLLVVSIDNRSSHWYLCQSTFPHILGLKLTLENDWSSYFGSEVN